MLPFYHMPCAQNHAAVPRVRARRARMGTVSVLESLRAVLHRPTENSLRTPLRTAACYVSMGTEISTMPLLSLFAQRGVRTLVPRLGSGAQIGWTVPIET